MNYEEMSDTEINKAVAEALGYGVVKNTFFSDDREYMLKCWCEDDQHENGGFHYAARLSDYCNDPSDAWPIIVENRISIEYNYSSDATVWHELYTGEFLYGNADSPLRAAMVVFLMMKDAE